MAEMDGVDRRGAGLCKKLGWGLCLIGAVIVDPGPGMPCVHVYAFPLYLSGT